jgi:hypothetical protein
MFVRMVIFFCCNGNTTNKFFIVRVSFVFGQSLFATIRQKLSLWYVEVIAVFWTKLDMS